MGERILLSCHYEFRDATSLRGLWHVVLYQALLYTSMDGHEYPSTQNVQID